MQDARAWFTREGTHLLRIPKAGGTTELLAVAAIVGKHRSPHPNLRLTQGRISIDLEMIVKPPMTNLLTK